MACKISSSMLFELFNSQEFTFGWFHFATTLLSNENLLYEFGAISKRKVKLDCLRSATAHFCVSLQRGSSIWPEIGVVSS